VTTWRLKIINKTLTVRRSFNPLTRLSSAVGGSIVAVVAMGLIYGLASALDLWAMPAL